MIVVLWAGMLTGCREQKTLVPIGTPISWDEFDSLNRNYDANQQERQGEVGFRIELSKQWYESPEQIEVITKLSNCSKKTINIRKISALGIENHLTKNGIEGVVFKVTSKETHKRIRVQILLDFIERGFPPVEVFQVLPPGKTYVDVLHLPDLEEELVPGKYQLQIRYRNQFFGGMVYGEEGHYFSDVNAWLGDIQSNVVEFEIR